MLRIAAGKAFPIAGDAPGAEIFVVGGSIRCDGEDLPAESWLRLPLGQEANLEAREDSVLWVKSGHLPPAAG
jgi:hypothetical protein